MADAEPVEVEAEAEVDEAEAVDVAMAMAPQETVEEADEAEASEEPEEAEEPDEAEADAHAAVPELEALSETAADERGLQSLRRFRRVEVRNAFDGFVRDNNLPREHVLFSILFVLLFSILVHKFWVNLLIF